MHKNKNLEKKTMQVFIAVFFFSLLQKIDRFQIYISVLS